MEFWKTIEKKQGKNQKKNFVFTELDTNTLNGRSDTNSKIFKNIVMQNSSIANETQTDLGFLGKIVIKMLNKFKTYSQRLNQSRNEIQTSFSVGFESFDPDLTDYKESEK